MFRGINQEQWQKYKTEEEVSVDCFACSWYVSLLLFRYLGLLAWYMCALFRYLGLLARSWAEKSEPTARQECQCVPDEAGQGVSVCSNKDQEDDFLRVSQQLALPVGDRWVGATGESGVTGRSVCVSGCCHTWFVGLLTRSSG